VTFRLVVVSNRVPLPTSDANAGGLAIGVRALLEEIGGLWFGWSGRVCDRPGHEVALHDLDSYSLATIAMSNDDFDGYYNGFANRTLWPLFHNRLDLASFDAGDFAAYRRVNKTFAERLLPLLGGNDYIWVHDYHLIPLAHELRRAGVTLPLGFFLHIPFPPPEILSALPWHEELVESLSAYDLVGFQTRRDWRHFRDFVERAMRGATTGDGTVSLRGRKFRSGVFPIGLDTDRMEAMAASAAVERLTRRLANCVEGRRGIIGVDRLDYTKGLPERFRAFEHLLESRPTCGGG
jgi:trehalose 6-phosphate synthase